MTILKELRAHKGATQQDLADILGITRGAYANIEAGRREPDIASLIKLSDYFQVTVDFLINPKGQDVPIQPKLSSDERFLFDSYHSLNEKGQEMLLDYAGYLSNSNQFLKSNSVSNKQA